MLYYLGLIPMAALYFSAGVMHFTNEKFFLKIVPPILPFKKAIVQVSGVVEIFLGITLLIPQTTTWAAWGVVVLLVVVYPANIYMLVARIQNKKFRKIPVWSLWLRLVLQFVLVYWAYIYTIVVGVQN